MHVYIVYSLYDVSIIKAVKRANFLTLASYQG